MTALNIIVLSVFIEIEQRHWFSYANGWFTPQWI